MRRKVQRSANKTNRSNNEEKQPNTNIKNSPALVARGVLDLLMNGLFINYLIDHDLNVSPGSPGSPNLSTRPPLDLHLTSNRPPVDRCQAILGDFLAPLGAKWPKCDFDDPYMVLGTFCSPRGAQVAPFGCLCGSRAPLGPPVGHQGCHFSYLNATLGAKPAKV